MATRKLVSFVDPTPEQDNWKRTGRGFDMLRYCKELRRNYHVRMSIVASKWPDAEKFLKAIADGLTRANCENARKVLALGDGRYGGFLGIQGDDDHEKAASIRSFLQGEVTAPDKEHVLDWMEAASHEVLYPLEKWQKGRKFLEDLKDALTGGDLNEHKGAAKRILALRDGTFVDFLEIEGDNDETKGSSIRSVLEKQMVSDRKTLVLAWLKAAQNEKFYPFVSSHDETDDAAIGEAHEANASVSSDDSDSPFFPKEKQKLFKKSK